MCSLLCRLLFRSVKNGWSISSLAIFLGFKFRDSANSIPTARKNSFLNMRSPHSQAETISRLGSITYFEETLPQLRKIAALLFEMVKSDQFKWGPVENSSVDSSQIATCYLIFHIGDVSPNLPLMNRIFIATINSKPSLWENYQLNSIF